MKNNVVIGIPVLNEEQNISKLLHTLLRQKELDFVLKKIIVLSDGSTDRTEAVVSEIAAQHPKVTLISGKKRLGKPARINQLFREVQADAVVVLDGDIFVRSDLLISRLVKPILRDGAALTSGRAQYLPPTTPFEKVMQVGLDMWDEVKKHAGNGKMYTCEGQIRAFSKQLVKQLVFPPFSADDVYPYLFCQIHHLSYRYVPNAVIYYGLPSTSKDFIKQHIRYLHSRAIQSRNFSREVVESSYVITLQEKLKVLIRYLLHSPLQVILYSLLLMIPKIAVYFESASQKSTWSIVQSTKK